MRKIPNKLRLRRGGGGGVGGCGVFAPRREISTSSRDTVSPEARESAERRKTEKRAEEGVRERASLCLCVLLSVLQWAINGREHGSVTPS